MDRGKIKYDGDTDIYPLHELGCSRSHVLTCVMILLVQVWHTQKVWFVFFFL